MTDERRMAAWLSYLYRAEMTAIEYADTVPAAARDWSQHTRLNRLERLAGARAFDGIPKRLQRRMWREALDAFAPEGCS